MPIPEFVLELRRHVGHALLWFPGVTAVVLRPAASGPGPEVLLVRRADDGTWTPVTGMVDPGEEPGLAARREAREETGVEVTVDRLAGVGATEEIVHANGDRSVYLDHTFACSWVSGEARVADDESVEVRWCPVTELGGLQPPMAEHMRARIDTVLADQVAARFVG